MMNHLSLEKKTKKFDLFWTKMSAVYTKVGIGKSFFFSFVFYGLGQTDRSIQVNKR